MQKPTIFTKDQEFFDSYNDVLDIVLLPDDAIVVELPETIDEVVASQPKAAKTPKNKPVKTTTRKKRKPTQCSTCGELGHTRTTCGRQSSPSDASSDYNPIPLTEEEYNQVKDCQRDDMSTSDTANMTGHDERVIREAYTSASYELYMKS